MRNAVILLLLSLAFIGCDTLSLGNLKPEAAFTYQLDGAAIRVDASDSKTGEGKITSYSWDFGDGKTVTGKVANHIYTKSGSYTITLTVKNDKGAEDKATKKIAVTVASNQAPQAKFTYTTATLTVNVDASSSSDSDGTIASYSWDFGDGKTATGKTAKYTYAAAGSYIIKLTVKDDKGAENSSSQNVTVSAPVNQVPQAMFVVKARDLAVTVDASSSSDSDGTIVSYSWDFGDGKTATGKTANHTYAAAGTYKITLKVKDDKGVENSTSQDVTVSKANVPNQAPEAKFSKKVDNLTVQVDASSSSDSDGTIVSYRWDFGDGKTATGKTANHTYAAAGTYTIKLTVKDDKGGKNSSSQNVTVSAPVNQVPQAVFKLEATALMVKVDASDSSDSDGTIVRYSWDFGDGKTATGKTANHTYAAAGSYTIKLTVKDDKGAENSSSQAINVSAANQAPEAKFSKAIDNLVVQVDASDSSDSDGTIVSYSWDFGDGKMATGKIANHTYAAAGSYTIKLTVKDDKGAQGIETETVTLSAANQAPEAQFAVDKTDDNLKVTVDASSSSDGDGTITSYRWDFGDGKTATGKKASHNYQSEGEYTITLTVKDDKGAEHQARQKVFLEDSATPAAKFTYIFMGRFVSVNGSHSNGNDGSIVQYEWDFGDGTKKTGVLSNHTYAKSGKYTIILTVTDRDGKKGRAGAEVSIR